MLLGVMVGDITDPNVFNGDIIIAMNRNMAQPSAIGRPFVALNEYDLPLELGSVVTYDWDPLAGRRLHMIICHDFGEGGWQGADKWLRLGLDRLWFESHDEPGRKFGIVQIGSGPVGRRDGANVSALVAAVSDSFLEVTMYVLPERPALVAMENVVPLRVRSAWAPTEGALKLQQVA